MNYFQIAETAEQHGSTYRASLFVDNDRKEAFLSLSKDGVLFVSGFSVRYGAVWDQSRARKALRQRDCGWSLMSRLCRAALLQEPFDAVEALEDFNLSAIPN